jgi:hypothetical protein
VTSWFPRAREPLRGPSAREPAFEIADHAADGRCHLAGRDIGDADPLEYGAKTGTDGDPYALQSLGRAFVYERLWSEATDLGQWSIDRSHHVGDLDLRGGPIWPLEVANVLLVAERRGRLSEAQASRFLELLAQLPINVDSSPSDVAGIVATGRRHTLSSYDAAYLLLAERLGAALATLDKLLAKAARKAGVHLLINP